MGLIIIPDNWLDYIFEGSELRLSAYYDLLSLKKSVLEFWLQVFSPFNFGIREVFELVNRGG